MKTTIKSHTGAQRVKSTSNRSFWVLVLHAVVSTDPLIYVCGSKAVAEAKLLEYVRAQWEEIGKYQTLQGDLPPLPQDPQQAIDEYFIDSARRGTYERYTLKKTNLLE